MSTNEISSLNRSYGKPGRIEFRPGPAGYPLVRLSEERGSCDVAFYGAHVLSYQAAESPPLLWMSKHSDSIVTGQAIRGGIPICSPWFGRHPGNDTLPSHGLVRTQSWQLLSTAYGSHGSRVTFRLKSDARTLALWPYLFEVELQVTVNESLSLALTLKNRDDTPLSLTQAFHPYFLVEEIARIGIQGLEGIAYQEFAPGGQDGCQDGVLKIAAETDRIYQQTTNECTLIDPGLGRKVVISKYGSNSMVVWNPWIEKAKRLDDMEDEAHRKFVCIEVANAGQDVVTLEPHSQHSLGLVIQSQPLQ